jgi:hypothetical protein
MLLYTVIQNFGFSLPKHSVLKNLPKHPKIQLKFRVKSTKHSSQFQHTRSFVFGKKIKFNTKLRDFNRNISGIGTRWPYHISSTFLEHIFKKMGSTEIVVSSVRPSVCPSVRPSVRPSPISQPLWHLES